MKTIVVTFITGVFLMSLAIASEKDNKEQKENHHINMTEEMSMEDMQEEDQIEGLICPVMGGAANKMVFTEYNGKKYYFCCPGCIAEFKTKPQFYIRKLKMLKK